MKNDKLLFAMDGIGDDLIAGAMEPKKQRRRPLLRWAAAAACVCLVTAVTAGADVLGNVLEEIGKTSSTYRAPERYTSANFSQEAIDAAKEYGEMDHITFPMDSLEELEEFVGMEHLDNEILDRARPKTVTTRTPDGAAFESAHNVLLSVSDGKILMANTNSFYTVDKATVHVRYEIVTENLSQDGGVAMIHAGTEDRADYTTPSGMTCTIYTNVDGFFTECTAFAAKGDCLIWVTVDYTLAEGETDTAQQLIRRIMDAYN